MADPLSIAASVAGLVSLGLQAYTGISTYLDAFRGRDDDLESARQGAKALESTVHVIAQLVPQLHTSHHVHTNAVSECVQACQKELVSFHGFLSKLESSLNPSDSFRDTARDQRKKLTYAFHRPNLDRLESRLGKVVGTLQSALQALTLHAQAATNSMLAGIEMATRDTPANLLRLNSELAAAGSTLGTVHNALLPIQDGVAELGPLLLSKANETHTQLARMERSTVSSMLAYHGLVSNAVKVADKRNAEFGRKLSSLENMITQRLVSAPSALREFSDDLISPQIAALQGNTSIARDNRLQGSTSSHSACLCRTRQYHQRQRRWGSLRFYNEIYIEESHLPDCPRRGFIRARNKRRYGVTYTGLVSIINTAIDVSFSTCLGAGAWSISPGLRCISTVDWRTAPAFRLTFILRMAAISFSGANYVKVTGSEWENLVGSVLAKIRWLFENRLAYPNDVDVMNETIMFQVAQVVFEASKCRVPNEKTLDGGEDAIVQVLRLVRTIRQYDVPVVSHNIWGRSAFGRLFGQFKTHKFWAAHIIDSIMSPTSEIIPFTSNGLKFEDCHWFPVCGITSSFEDSSTYAESWGCDPLSLAIVAENTEEITNLLRKQPALLKEINLLGQTPFHLAARNPGYLQLILEHLSPADHDLCGKEDASEDNALVYAAAGSLKQCRSNSHKKKCHRCTCASSLVMLLKRNLCSLPLRTILEELFDTEMSLRCKIKFINHLRNRGEILQRLALNSSFWTRRDSEAYNLHSTNVLDAYVSPVINILESHGVHIPPSLRSCDRGVASVYHFLRDADDAEEFYSRGFRDVDVEDSDGFVPLDVEYLRPSYLSWLVEHSAQCTELLPHHPSEISACKRHGYRVAVSQNRSRAHEIAFRIGNSVPYPWEVSQYFDSVKEAASVKVLSTRLLPVEFADDCNCPCSDRGCTPWTDMMKGVCYREDYQSEEWNCGLSYERPGVNWVPILGERFSNLLQTGADFLKPQHLRAAIRFLTFTGLGLTHVCCRPCSNYPLFRPHFHRVYTGQEAHELRELESTELSVMEDLVSEFSDKLNLDSADFSVNITALCQFWEHHWVPRIEEAVENLKGPADCEQDIRGAEEIGIVWDQADDKEEVLGYEYFANKIDEIMEDARGKLKEKSN